MGLSPRVRGNRVLPATSPRAFGSIPASAGQPLSPQAHSGPPSVYPRECGATPRALSRLSLGVGLSPRVRGNLCQMWRACIPVGSIPASAGQPKSRWCRRCKGSVYPRECGATCAKCGEPVYPWGLSPRVRGNRRVVGAEDARGRSIPASAGQPAARDTRGPEWRVYPRECGATPDDRPVWVSSSGLSPRVRGNRSR